MDADVIVVGAGVAGLAAAQILTSSGEHVVVLEAGDAVGGRIRTDKVDGFLLDRGFQVLNPAYPVLRRVVDLDQLGVQPFQRGLRVRRDEGLVTLVDPRRHPLLVPDSVRSGLLSPTEMGRLAAWVAPALGSIPALARQEDMSLAASLDAAGVDGPLRREVLEPFLAGILGEREGSTSANFARILLRSFIVGTPGLPTRGMGSLPELMAGDLPEPVRLGVAARSVTASGVGTDGGELRARAVVVATDPRTAAELTGRPTTPMRGLVTDWYEAAEKPEIGAMMAVDGRPGAGPVVNVAAVSAASAGYAPLGRHLIQATSLLPQGAEPASEAEVRRQTAEINGCAPEGLTPLRRDVVRDAICAQPPPLMLRQSVWVRERLFVCGDHRDTASIQGAIVSGRRAAVAVLRSLGQL